MHIVLNSFGSAIRKENDLFVVTTAGAEQKLHPADVKTITLSKGARISSDAVLLAIEHQIDVLFVDAVGTPQGRVWSVKYGSISQIRQKQVEFLYSEKAIQWVKEIVTEKINNQIALLLAFSPDDYSRAHNIIRHAINSMEDHKNKILKAEGDTLHDMAPSIRGWEGAASKRYFQALAALLPEPYRFEKRTTHPATDPFNACLNYGYGILYGKVESALVKAGIDPYMGVFHRDEYNRPALVFDVIEKFRIWIDYVVIQLFRQDAFTDECFERQPHQCLLEGLGKRILIQSVNDYLAEIITLNHLERSRATHIEHYAQTLAKLFLKH
ncbi:MAG: CRISPR-associated endonuclease Cas1 [Chitinophagales bacterium]|nr:MAG: CRISPR-associated endonuclease Cas1 [Chitinophagales bacterium]